MSDFEIHYQDDGFYEINVMGDFKESDAEYLSKQLQDIYEPNHSSYVCIDLSAYHVLPLRILGLSILRFYRKNVYQSPMFIALIVQPSIAHVLGSVLKTLMHREWIQTFTVEERAKQWLVLEQKKRQNYSGQGK